VRNDETDGERELGMDGKMETSWRREFDKRNDRENLNLNI